MFRTLQSWHARRQEIRRQRLELAEVAVETIDCGRLRPIKRSDLDRLFTSPTVGEEWPAVANAIAALLEIEDMKTSGVNPGDRRALYYLVRAFRPGSVLEIGTNVGASTMHIAAALKQNSRDANTAGTLVTVDINDVNDAADSYWRRAVLPRSPRDTIALMGMANGVSFVTQNSFVFFDNVQASFDLIFLDGDHSAATVYREIARALEHLRKDGVIVLHDVFPHHRPFWKDQTIQPGPWLAVRRLQREGAGIDVLPLGALPWPTKLGTNVTSLALLTGA